MQYKKDKLSVVFDRLHDTLDYRAESEPYNMNKKAVYFSAKNALNNEQVRADPQIRAEVRNWYVTIGKAKKAKQKMKFEQYNKLYQKALEMLEVLVKIIRKKAAENPKPKLPGDKLKPY